MGSLSIAHKIVQKAFKSITDKGGDKYVNHLYRVLKSIEVDYPNINEDVKCIALLHDLLEDCPEWNVQSLSTFFNERVIEGVVALTRKEGQNYEDFITQVLENSDAILVKKYDLIDNMDITRLQSLEDKDFQRLKKYHVAWKRITS